MAFLVIRVFGITRTENLLGMGLSGVYRAYMLPRTLEVLCRLVVEFDAEKSC